MSILITGGSGFIALNLAEVLLKRSEEVVLFSRHSPPEIVLQIFQSLEGKLHTVKGDVRDRTSLERTFQDYHVDRVFHAAVITANQERERRDFRSIIEVNLLGTAEVLEVSRQAGIQRFVYLSSSSVYGRNAFKSRILDEEETVPLPETLYAITKYAGEQASLRFKRLWNMDLTVARVGTVFGPWERDTGVRDTLSPQMQTTQMAIQGKAAVLPGVGQRDWVYSRDVANALVAILDGKHLHHDVYNIGPGVEWTIETWCSKLKESYPGFSYRLASGQEISNINYHLPQDRAPFAIKRLAEDIGFKPQFGLDEAFMDYLKWVEHFPMFWGGDSMK
jgi:nucleoside-diphosphate-sugar epimerase